MEFLCTASDNLRAATHDMSHKFTKELEKHIVRGGFMQHNKTLEDRGTCTQLGHIKMLTFTIAGRCMVTLHRGDEQVSFVYDDTAKEDPRMGLQSIDTSMSNAGDMVREACIFWECTPDPVKLVKIDGGVGFG